MQRNERKKDWTLSSAAFRRLLEWFDQGVESGGQKYLEIRGRLISYFDRKNCLLPDELADETLNRVARRLEETGEIETETPAKFCYITARFVFLESLRAKETRHLPLADSLNQMAAETDEKEEKEKTLDCLDKCTNNLDAANRQIILGYYIGEERVKIENRRAMAERLEISVNALSIRACRIRDKLETCVKKCVEKK